MDLVTFAVAVIAVATVALVAVLVPAVQQLRITLSSVDRLVKDLDETVRPLIEDDIKPMVRSVTATLDEVNGVVKRARDGVEMVDDVLESVKEVGDTVRTINDIANNRIKSTLVDISAYVAGLKAALETVMTILRLHKKEV